MLLEDPEKQAEAKISLIQSLNGHNIVFFRTTLPLGIRQQCRAQPLVRRAECRALTGWCASVTIETFEMLYTEIECL